MGVRGAGGEPIALCMLCQLAIYQGHESRRDRHHFHEAFYINANNITNMAPNKIVELSSIISSNTQKVNDYLEKQGLPTPSLDASAPAYPLRDDAPTYIKDAALAAADACSELNALMTGPRELIRFNVSISKYELHSLVTIHIVD